MEEQFIPYEQALELKELGFDEKCLMAFYGSSREDKKDELFLHNGFGRIRNSNLIDETGVIAAPLWQQAFDWFREKHSLIVCCDFGNNSYFYWIISKNEELFFGPKDEENNAIIYATYEEARLECLKKLIKIVKNK